MSNDFNDESFQEDSALEDMILDAEECSTIIVSSVKLNTQFTSDNMLIHDDMRNLFKESTLQTPKHRSGTQVNHDILTLLDDLEDDAMIELRYAFMCAVPSTPTNECYNLISRVILIKGESLIRIYCYTKVSDTIGNDVVGQTRNGQCGRGAMDSYRSTERYRG